MLVVLWKLGLFGTTAAVADADARGRNDNHPRSHLLLGTTAGLRSCPAYDMLPVAMVRLERRNLALAVGRVGRAANFYDLLSQGRDTMHGQVSDSQRQPVVLCGSPTWARTRDLRINSPALYQLSYRGTASHYSQLRPAPQRLASTDSRNVLGASGYK